MLSSDIVTTSSGLGHKFGKLIKCTTNTIRQIWTFLKLSNKQKIPVLFKFPCFYIVIKLQLLVKKSFYSNFKGKNVIKIIIDSLRFSKFKYKRF